ncbi:MAG: hypothetical protein AB7F32_03800 [Victivallaceae bacterium]
MKIVCEKCRRQCEVDHSGSCQCPCGHTIEVPGPTSNLTLCPDCGRLVSKSARNCPGCGRPIQGMDKPSGGLLFMLWTVGLLLPPLTSVVVIVITSILHSQWKSESPGKAAAIRKQGWLIFVVGIALTVLTAVVTVQAARMLLGELGPLLQ